MKTLYFDCYAGASGNMILGGLVSLGVEPDELRKRITKLNVSDFDIEFSTVDRAGVSSIHAATVFDEEKNHRGLSEITEIIDGSDLPDGVKERSRAIFARLAAAEAKVHGIDIDRVHFHEVGAMDAIIDVVGACIGFELLGVREFVCSKINTGSGFVQIDHGKYPVPGPAVTELLKGATVYSNEIEGELITPTGAAIIAEVCTEFGQIPALEIAKTGYGAGTREYEAFPNALRLVLGRKESIDTNASTPDFSARKLLVEELVLVETNVDDISSEILGYVMEKALGYGVPDCWFTPIQMKKNRPATQISVLCTPDQADQIVELLLLETTTLGVRITETKRHCLEREHGEVKTEYGTVDVKIARYRDRIVNVKPEFEALRRIALKTGKPIKQLEEIVLKKYSESQGNKKVVGK